MGIDFRTVGQATGCGGPFSLARCPRQLFLPLLARMLRYTLSPCQCTPPRILRWLAIHKLRISPSAGGVKSLIGTPIRLCGSLASLTIGLACAVSHMTILVFFSNTSMGRLCHDIYMFATDCFAPTIVRYS